MLRDDRRPVTHPLLSVRYSMPLSQPLKAGETFNYEIIPAKAREPAQSYEVDGYPTHFVIDQDGRIAWQATGGSPTNMEACCGSSRYDAFMPREKARVGFGDRLLAALRTR